jgi:hypothetical protein
MTGSPLFDPNDAQMPVYGPPLPPPEPCKHPNYTTEIDCFSSGTGWAECRTCGQVADFNLDFEEWMDPDEYDRQHG